MFTNVKQKLKVNFSFLLLPLFKLDDIITLFIHKFLITSTNVYCTHLVQKVCFNIKIFEYILC